MCRILSRIIKDPCMVAAMGSRSSLFILDGDDDFIYFLFGFPENSRTPSDPKPRK